MKTSPTQVLYDLIDDYILYYDSGEKIVKHIVLEFTYTCIYLVVKAANRLVGVMGHIDRLDSSNKDSSSSSSPGCGSPQLELSLPKLAPYNVVLRIFIQCLGHLSSDK